ncbi:MAG: alpha-ketoglutarate-dependent dioxygenase AlkB [Pirellula sp.]
MNRQLLLFPDVAELPKDLQRDFTGIPDLVYFEQFLDPIEQVTLLRDIDAQPWRDDLKRRVQHYGYRYDYKARRVDPSMYLGSLPPFLQNVGTRLLTVGLMPRLPDQAIINEYEPGQGITPHVDCEPCFGGFIATVSLNSVYTMDFTDTQSEEVKAVRLALGSCLVFSGEARYRWKHGIKARRLDDGIHRGRRVSVTFRTVTI